MSAISGLAFAVKAYTPQLARLKVGLLLKEILERFQNKTLGGLTPNRSLFIYSGHDTTVANLLNILGVFKIIGVNFLQKCKFFNFIDLYLLVPQSCI